MGKKLSKEEMLKAVSKNLGHNRLSVLKHYLPKTK